MDTVLPVVGATALAIGTLLTYILAVSRGDTPPSFLSAVIEYWPAGVFLKIGVSFFLVTWVVRAFGLANLRAGRLGPKIAAISTVVATVLFVATMAVPNTRAPWGHDIIGSIGMLFLFVYMGFEMTATVKDRVHDTRWKVLVGVRALFLTGFVLSVVAAGVSYLVGQFRPEATDLSFTLAELFGLAYFSAFVISGSFLNGRRWWRRYPAGPTH